jgi:small subunit ribosomal protein S13
MRILGINIPNNKHLDIGLTSLNGIGLSRARKILEQAKVDKNRKLMILNVDEENAISKNNRNNANRRKSKKRYCFHIKRLKDIKSYRGIRHMRRLPVNGQRTKNSRTVRGNVRMTMGSGRRKAEKTLG